MRFATAEKIWRLMTRSERRSAIVLLAMMFLGMVLETLGIGLIVPAMALLTQPERIPSSAVLEDWLQPFGGAKPEVLIVAAMFGLSIVFFFKNLFLGFLTWRQNRFAYDVQAQLSQRLYGVYLEQPYAFHLQRNSAELLRNLTTDVAVFTNSAMIPALLLISESLVLIGLCGLLMFVEPIGALVVVGVLTVAGWGFHRATRRRIVRWGEARQLHEGGRIRQLQQGFGGVKDVKMLGRENEFIAEYSVHNDKSARAGQLQFTLQQIPRLWLELLAVLGLAILVLMLIAQGRPVAAVLPTLALFAAVAFRLMPSANRLLGAIQLLRYGLPVIDTLYAELQLHSSAARSDLRKLEFNESLELRGVDFTYSGAPAPALSDLTLRVRRGEAVGFIGSSGAGKSTLVDIVLGLLTPDRGCVLVDGQDIRGSERSWRQRIGYVPQTIFLTDDTLRRNVAFGLPEDRIDDVAVERAIKAAQLDDFVRMLSDGLNTMVGERGVRLSGGQRQRIGIARALYHDPAVLVLDEATSSLDTATEQEVMRSVNALKREKTLLIVAHRMSTIETCDRLFRLDLGRLTDEGAPAEILARKFAHP